MQGGNEQIEDVDGLDTFSIKECDFLQKFFWQI
jgi:hypothetical protein